MPRRAARAPQRRASSHWRRAGTRAHLRRSWVTLTATLVGYAAVGHATGRSGSGLAQTKSPVARRSQHSVETPDHSAKGSELPDVSSDEPSLRSKSRAASHKPHSAHATQTSFSRMCFHVFISSATTINISKHTAPLTVTRYRSEIQLSSCNGPRSCVSPSSPRVRCRKACVLYLLQLIRCMDAAKFSEAET